MKFFSKYLLDKASIKKLKDKGLVAEESLVKKKYLSLCFTLPVYCILNILYSPEDFDRLYVGKTRIPEHLDEYV